MMGFLVREVAGWLLVGLGLLSFYIAYDFIRDKAAPSLLQTGPMVIMGVILFRGGIHLLKVAVAARLSTRAEPPRDGATTRKSPPIVKR